MRSVIRFTIPAAAVASVVFASVGSTGALATASNLAAGQPVHVINAAYTVPAFAIPVDGDGNPHPAPAPIHPAPAPSWPYVGGQYPSGDWGGVCFSGPPTPPC